MYMHDCINFYFESLCNAYTKYINDCVVYTMHRKVRETAKDGQINIRTDESDERILAAIREKLPNKNDSEIIRTALKMMAVELGATA